MKKPTFPSRRQILTLAASLTTVSALPAAAQTASYPSKPITIVSAYPAGGDTDALARMFADKLSARLGQPVVVENRLGAGGMIGSAYVAKAAPDGYTLLLAPNTFVITPHVIQGSPATQYDPVKDFTPIIDIGGVSLFVVVSTASGITSLKDLVAQAKAGKVKSYASPGYGSPMHILAELFDKSAGTKIEQIPYKGSAPAVIDLVGGQIPLMYSTLGPVMPFIKSGKLVALAVADPQRSPFLPDVPTLAELGYQGADVGGWQALVGPKGMRADLVQLLNKHCNEILKMPDVVARMANIAMVPTGGNAARLAQIVSSEYERYGKIVKEFGIRSE